MGFHTFEVRYKLDYDSFSYIKDELSKKGKFYNDKKNSNDRATEYVSEALIDKGIIIKITTFDQKIKESKRRPIVIGNEYIYHFILQYIINPRRVMDENNFVGIFNSNNVDEMLQRANKYIKSVFKYLPEVTSCNLYRIDFCYNVQLDNDEEVNMLLKLLKRCYVPSGFEMEKYYDKKAKKKVISQDGITLFRKKYVKIVFYNKKRQMKKSKYNYPDGNDADGIIRFEIQCLYRKAYNLKDKIGAKSLKEFLYEADNICEEQFNHYLPKMFGKGDFYTKNKAEQIVEESRYSQKSKDLMLELIDRTAEHKSLHMATEKMLEKGLSKNKLGNLMKKFNECNISPITIPRRWKVDRMENPLTQALDWKDYV